MIRAFTKVFRLPHLRRRALFALLTCVLAVAVYRVGFYVPSPGINKSELARYSQQSGDEGTLLATPLWTDEVSRP